jgi:hypothetical protein
VFLFAHDSLRPPIGVVSSIGVVGSQLLASVKFDTDDPFAELIRGKFLRKIMRAVSVGFRPTEFEERKSKNSIFGIGILFKQQELLELSAVPVPAHPMALRKALDSVRTMYQLSSKEIRNWNMLEEASSGILVVKHTDIDSNTDDGTVGGENGNIKVNWLYESAPVAKSADEDHRECATCERVYNTLNQLFSMFPNARVSSSREGDTIGNVLRGSVLKGVLGWNSVHPNGTPKASKNSEWDDAAERRRAGVEDLRVMSAWVDSSNPDIKASYKLPHHRSGGDHPVVFRALSAAVGALNGARGGVDIPDDDRKGVYEHLAKHYRDDFDEEPPDLRDMSSGDSDSDSDSGSKDDAKNIDIDTNETVLVEDKQLSDILAAIKTIRGNL